MPNSADDKIEVTPEMIKAGAFEMFMMLGPGDGYGHSFEEVAASVFKKMSAARTKSNDGGTR